MSRLHHTLRHRLALIVGLATVVACGASPDAAEGPAEPGAAPDAGAPAEPAVTPEEEASIVERPWEVVSKKGETYLANVFYADASENEQIMPYAIDGHVQIDRLVYPTLGNPNLFTKADAADEMVAVLRVEDAAFDFTGPRLSPEKGSPLSRVELANPGDGVTDGFVFYLVPRTARDAATTSPRALPTGAIAPKGVIAVRPSAIYQNPTPPDLPARLAQRRTLRFVFDARAMADVPPGLYDLRFEVKKGGALHEPRGAGSGVYEYQYNAVRVFDTEPDEYDVVNVTDTQVSVGSIYDGKTKLQLDQLAKHLSTSTDPKVTNAAFMTFNGDLHNGGSPASLRQRTVANTYAAEAKAIVSALAQLPMPVFLTPGNHDGYVSIGQVPSAIKASDAAMFDDLKEVVEEASPRAWPGFTWASYAAYLDATAKADQLGGFHRDVFVGAFSRTVSSTFAGWKELPREKRNIVLYDGLHQWQKTYGPLYESWRFGKNRYVSLNTYELRQHRRSGWGMYTVNFGGGMSQVQMDWLDREIVRSKKEDSDVVLLAHHDPRGGHKGKDHGYYFEQLEYRSVAQSAINYLSQKVWNPAVCSAPDWALSRSQEESCTHDGLQEWMRPDDELDCATEERIPTESGQDVCEKALFDPALGDRAHSYWWSGHELVKRLARTPRIRTFLLGHTHYNEVEVLQSGDALLPGQPTIEGAAVSTMAWREIQNPMRGYSVMQDSVGFRPDYDPNAVAHEAAKQRVLAQGALLRVALPRAQRVMEGAVNGPRELLFLRTVSNADLANQRFDGKSALGYAVLRVRKGGDAVPRIEGGTFFVNASGAFNAAADVRFDRRARLAPRAPENPLVKVFQLANNF